MKYVQLTFDTLFLQFNHQQFFYFDKDNTLKTTAEMWPELQSINLNEELSLKANELLVIIKHLVLTENTIQISRENVYKKSRVIVKKAANLNELLCFLNLKGYVTFQFSGVYGRKQFITLNPKIFQFVL